MIRVMPPHLAAKIAAGEVIERPASIVKELVENALDAGATHVDISIEDGGLTRVSVADDGSGILPDDVEIAFRRHATSKLVEEADLGRLHTLGFRGEALPSIATVSDLTLTTRCASERAAVQLSIDSGALEQRLVARQPGTSVVVENVFARFPARRKFMRGRSAEAAAAVQAIAPHALAYPEVQFSVLVDGRPALRTPGGGSLRDAATAVLGEDAGAHLLDIAPATFEEGGTELARVSGVCATGSYHRASRTGIHLLVNRRPIQSASLVHAVTEAYGSLLPIGRRPVAVLDIRVAPSEVDFNVHPSKLEVKLLRERAVYGLVQRALRDALADQHWEVSEWAVAAQPTSGPFSAPIPGSNTPLSPPIAAPFAGFLDGGERLEALRILGQVGRTYVIAEGDAGLYLVDQHAAHERVMLERLRDSIARKAERQLLMEPLLLDVPAQTVRLVEQASSDLERLGFDVCEFGPGQVLVRAVPAAVARSANAQVIQDVLGAAASDTHGLVLEKSASWIERLSLVLACKTAVRAGDVLSDAEMRALLHQLGEAELCRTCAHGRPTAILLSHSQLEHQFGRR